jgi:hypothetical protein
MAKAQSHVTKLLNLVAALCKDFGAELFHATSGDPYLHAPVFREPGQVAFYDSLPLHSDACGQYLRRQYYNAEAKGLTSSALKDAIETLAGSAKMTGPERAVYTRVAGFDDRVLLDLANADRQVVVVTATGWSVDVCPRDVRFVRRPGMLALPTPTATVERVEDLISSVLNITDERSQQLLVAWWLVTLRGRKPYFIIVIRGEAGSAKTVGSEIIRMVVDPNEANSSSAPKDERDLMISAKGCHVCSFDNLSYLPEDLADALCRLATGSGMRTRQLHTDDTEKIFKAARPIIINGIPDLLSRADLASRSVVIELDHIPDDQRRTEADVYAKVAVQQPKVLGALLNVLAAVLQRQPTLTPTRLPRMADAALTVMAAEEALGWSEGTFLALMDENEGDNASALLDGDLVFDAIKTLPLPWTGDLKDFFKYLPVYDERNKPFTAKGVATRLRRMTGALRRLGIVVSAPKGQEAQGELRGKRLWQLSAVSNTCNTFSYVANPEMKKEGFVTDQRVSRVACVAGRADDPPF